jgi:uncharacterized protein YaiI (UPF0178 family)
LCAVLVIDTANVLGSRPTGWWRDRAGATRSLVERVRASTLPRPIVMVVEGQARSGAMEGVEDGVQVVHARGEGDDTIAELARADVTVVTADRGLATRARAAAAEVVGPNWLYDRLDG